MKIQWQRTTKIDRKKPNKNDQTKGSESPTKKPGANDASVVSNGGQNPEKEEEVKFVYAIVPDQIVLNPKMGIMI
jgi:hypothetical protein